jgi:transposase-like protein
MKSSQVMAKRTATKVPKKHSSELKVSMARKVIEEGKSQSSLAAATGISITNIYKWTQLARAGELPGYVAPAFDAKTGDVQSEVRRLTRALAEMTAQRDFLKKTTIYFAKDQG